MEKQNIKTIPHVVKEIKSFDIYCKECGGVEDVLYTTSGLCSCCEEENL